MLILNMVKLVNSEVSESQCVIPWRQMLTLQTAQKFQTVFFFFFPFFVVAVNESILNKSGFSPRINRRTLKLAY